MGISFELKDRTIRFVTVGDVDFAAGLQVLEAALATAAEQGSGWGLLFDIRSSSENRSADELRGVAEVIARHRDALSGQCAILAADPLHYGLARMFGVFAESLGLTAMVFRTEAEALAWLTTPKTA